MTVFRQTQFADFELRAHQLAQQGKPLTGESLARLYLDITTSTTATIRASASLTTTSRTSGARSALLQQLLRLSGRTSFTAATALSEGVLTPGAAGADATKRYIRFLSPAAQSTRSNPPKDAGVDMTTDQPLELTIRKMNRVMDEIEKLLGN